MLALVLAIALAYPTTAQGEPIDHADRPLAQLYDIRPIQEGEPSPVSGRVMDNPTYIQLGQRIASAEAERDALKAAPPTSVPWAWLGLLAVGVFGAGIWVGVATRPR